MSDFDNRWIEIFRSGDYGDKGDWPPERVQQVVKNFNLETWQPPEVLGHPAHDDPAMGHVAELREEGGVLSARFTNVHPALETLVQDGRYPNRSAAFYLDPQDQGPILRHVGFLGAMPPEIKGLAPIQFSDGDFVAIEFKEKAMQNHRRLVHFTEPGRRLQIDPDSVVLAERVETLKPEIRKEFANFTESQIHQKAYDRAFQEAAASRSIPTPSSWLSASKL